MVLDLYAKKNIISHRTKLVETVVTREIIIIISYHFSASSNISSRVVVAVTVLCAFLTLFALFVFSKFCENKLIDAGSKTDGRYQSAIVQETQQIIGDFVPTTTYRVPEEVQ